MNNGYIYKTYVTDELNTNKNTILCVLPCLFNEKIKLTYNYDHGFNTILLDKNNQNENNKIIKILNNMKYVDENDNNVGLPSIDKDKFIFCNYERSMHRNDFNTINITKNN